MKIQHTGLLYQQSLCSAAKTSGSVVARPCDFLFFNQEEKTRKKLATDWLGVSHVKQQGK